MSKFYVSTPIYYVNGAPHIGHAYTTIVADALARFHRQQGSEVFFQTGTDEHGLKIQREAEKQGISPKKLADKNSALFQDLFAKLEISHDRFLRTTDEDHRQVVTEIVKRMKANDDIYLGEYAGWYAAADEAFYGEDEIEDGKSIVTGAPVEWVEEKSYFFRLSKYKEKLLAWYGLGKSVLPKVRCNEVSSFVEGDLRDLSISRTTFDWGIPFPGDPEHVLYVWVDALTNYITGAGAFLDEERYARFWPCDLHLIGKDILRFHTVYWPAFLMSAGLEPPKQVLAHGWWLNEGEKMSKRAGNFLDAFALADDYELDVLRYYLLREVPLGNDGNFVQERLIGRNNSELADNVGNLVNRTTKMASRFLEDSKLPAFVESTEEVDVALRKKAVEARDAFVGAMEKVETHRAAEILMKWSGDLNQYVHQTEPWKLNKEKKTQRLGEVLYHALEGIRWVGVLAGAILPRAAVKILAGFGLEGEQALSFASISSFGSLPEGTPILAPEVLFQKLELPKDEAAEPPKKKKEKKKKEKKKEPVEDKLEETIQFDSFIKVDLRVAKIQEAALVEGAKKLLQLTLDLGKFGTRNVFAGIRASFPEPSVLVGKQVVMVANLAPRKMRFGVSEGMVLATGPSDDQLVLMEAVPPARPGDRVS